VVAGIADIMWRLAPEQYCPVGVGEGRNGRRWSTGNSWKRRRWNIADALAAEVWHAQNLVLVLGNRSCRGRRLN